MKSKQRRPLVGWIVVATLGALVVVGFYASREYSRFPLHLLPHWQIFEAWRVQRTRSDIAEIERALHDFAVHYGHLPVVRPEHEDQFVTTLGHELNGVRPGPDAQNSEAIVFWKLPAGEQLDGWNHRYHVWLDFRGSGQVHPGGKTLNRPFAIWSDGPNGKDEGGEGDDLRNWQPP